jgi:hypothetical protein
MTEWANSTSSSLAMTKWAISHLSIQIVARGAPDSPNVPFTPLNLRATVIEARDLAKMDTFGKSDPYCLVNIVNTPDIFNTTVKDETHEFVVTNPLFDTLHVFMRDKDLVFDDDMAVLDVPLAPLGDLKAKDDWYPLVPVEGVPKGGQIRLALHLFTAPPQSYADVAPGNLGKLVKKKK